MPLSNRLNLIDSPSNFVARVKTGDKKAIKAFYLAEKDGFVKWMISKYSVSQEELNDIYQEAMIILLENIRKGLLDELQHSVKTYLYAVAKHLVYRKYKEKQRRIDHHDRLKEQLVFYIEEEIEPEIEELSKRAKKVLEQTEEPCKSILILSYYENLKASDVAKRLGYKNEAVVRNQKKRCLDRLKEQMNEIQRRRN